MADINIKLTIKPKSFTKRLLSILSDRGSDVLSGRFGLGDTLERKTLDAIGKKYGITRERVRQIENAALRSIRKSDIYKEEQPLLDELRTCIEEAGVLLCEDELLELLAKNNQSLKNHYHFYLTLGDDFNKQKEDDHFHTCWNVNTELSEKVHDALHMLYENLDDDEIVSEPEIIEKFLGYVRDLSEEYKEHEIAKRWLRTFKKVKSNPLGEWGKANSSNIKTRGVRDYAFLAMRKHGNPMHFREVAKAVSEFFGRKTHPATCHNELIKDPRFVLVGRGVYALKDWGYQEGTAREVIEEILKSAGSLTKDEIIDRVMKERYFKKNTIAVNLHNSKYFKKQKDGTYAKLQK